MMTTTTTMTMMVSLVACIAYAAIPSSLGNMNCMHRLYFARSAKAHSPMPSNRFFGISSPLSHRFIQLHAQMTTMTTTTAAAATAAGARRGRRSAGKLARCQSIEDIDIIHLISSCLHTSSTYVLSLHKTKADISTFLLQPVRFQ